MNCIICSDPQTDRCHIKSKGAGGTWDDHNILRLCRIHHRQQHSKGFKWMADTYNEIAEALIEKGWVFENQFGRWRLIRGEE